MQDNQSKPEGLAAVASGALFGAWSPIATAPKDRKAILVHCPEIKCSFCATWDDITKVWRHFGGSSYAIEREISHWMPLPPAPNDKSSHGGTPLADSTGSAF